MHWTPGVPRVSRTLLAMELQYVLAAALCYWFYRAESKRLESSQAIGLVFLIIALTMFVNQMHGLYVDHASNWPPSNLAWQERLQELVIALSPAALPHSYRFLPNSIVLWMQLFRVRFDVARDIYRLFSGLLLFYLIYRYARLYTTHWGGMAAMMLVALPYPISFEGYAGQLTDPLSFVSFVLAFIFLETENFVFLLSTLLLGSLAKETVLALCGFYAIFCRKQQGYRWKALTLCAASVAMYIAVRAAVLHGSIQYQQVSGVPLEHVAANWNDPPWPMHLLTTVGPYVPLLALAWKKTPPSLNYLALYLFPVLFLSNLGFSWLNETRNFMPLVMVLAVVAGRFLSGAVVPGSTV